MSATLKLAVCILLLSTAHAEEAGKPPGSSSSSGSSTTKASCKAVVTAARPSIVVIGDGLTESAFLPDRSGWGSLLAGNYTRKVWRKQHTAAAMQLWGACRPGHDPRHCNNE